MEIKDIKLKSNELFKNYDSIVDKYDIEPSKANLLELKEISIKKDFFGLFYKSDKIVTKVLIDERIEHFFAWPGHDFWNCFLE